MNRSQTQQPDYVFIITFLIILIFGLIMLSSVSTAVAYEKFKDSYYYLKHQLIFGIIPGLIVLYVFSKLDYRRLRKLASPLLVVTIVLLIAVFLPVIGYDLKGAHRWINIGGILFQPSEIAKLTFLIYLATWFESKGERKLKDVEGGLMPFIIALGLIMVLIILQPDVGTTLIIMGVALVVYFAGGGQIKHLIMLLVGAAGILWILIKIAPYRAARFTVFLHPELDPQGIGYHINQSLLAIGSGGLFGLGLGHSRQKHLYLPEVIGDSIFAVMAEELGFFIMVGLIILYLVLAMRGFKIAREAPDKFGRLLAVGITAWICFQGFVNISAMVGLMPLTGLTLPFISYGSSSLVVFMAAVGIMINISRQAKQGTKYVARV